MVKIALDSIGCKLNQAEMQLLARQLADAGYKLVAPDDEADIYILNTCTVTHIADRKCRNWLRQVRLRNPEALVAAIGCYSERARDELRRIEGVNLVLGNEHKSDLLKILSESGYGGSAGVNEETAASRTRAFIKVQDGCNSFCSYCIVPLVRGREKSVLADEVIREVERRVADGFKEVVITGTEIGSYHHDGVNLKGLLERILAETGVTRLRLSSLQPQEVTSEFISLWRDERLCRHFHLSLQSGSDSVLKRMKRRYSTVEYEQAVAVLTKGRHPLQAWDGSEELKVAEKLEGLFPEEILPYYISGLGNLNVNATRKEYARQAKVMARIRRVYLDILKSEKRWRDFAGKIKRETLRRPALQEEFARAMPGWRELP